ncbi:MAG TPA: DUF2059 domain-containing protein [Kiritimatiellia bacterium]|jgi:hypothetical protein|nr:DUF2059 domain-containing protein [Kiritimatiellia bacterium]OQC59782.1 MAG: hypothetical protein BWX54_00489 [Verrucomicrobia bacterium ADurb.Bin018]MBP9573013.1 DUF2059 domain-containing protein [Kiritimatiellia bacterium]HOE00130.1 DUF2059 domain-containing protein [Kiritimatiellia bacterium]HOE37425.1 DUF2059 domain-containing protein [Kiritimatiellia bacterium]
MKRMAVWMMAGGLMVLAACAGPVEHQQLAERLVDALRVGPLCTESLHAIVGEAVAVEPRLAGKESELLTFLEEHVGWETLKPAAVALYKARFSEEDLREIVRFYESDAGRRFMEGTMDVAGDIMDLVDRRVKAVSDDWEVLVAELLFQADAQ